MRLFAFALLACLVASGCDSPHAPGAANSRAAAPADSELAAELRLIAAGDSTSLVVEDQPLGDADLKPLAGLTELVALTLRKGAVSDQGLGRIKELKKLEKLVLGDTTVTDAGLESLLQMTRLKILNFNRAEVTSAGFEHLTALEQLELIRFGESRIDDDALSAVGKWPKLRALILQNAPITDAGLKQLAGLERLESLYLEGTQVTEEGLMQLQRELPNLHIHPHP